MNYGQKSKECFILFNKKYNELNSFYYFITIIGELGESSLLAAFVEHFQNALDQKSDQVAAKHAAGA